MEEQVNLERWLGFPITRKHKPQSGYPGYVDPKHGKIVAETLYGCSIAPVNYEPERAQERCNYEQDVCSLWNSRVAVKESMIPHEKENHRHEERPPSYEEEKQED